MTPAQAKARKKNWQIYMLKGAISRIKTIANSPGHSRPVVHELRMAVVNIMTALDLIKQGDSDA